VIRINLLPPEIIAKRKAERRWVYVMFGALGVTILLFSAWGYASLAVMNVRGELADKEQQATNLSSQAELFKVFEAKQADLEARKVIADKALVGKIDWAKLLTEFSLVLPNDVWLSSLAAAEDSGLTLDGQAVDAVDAPDSGHKAIAKLLVRLADLDQLYNVWLGSSTKAEPTEEGGASTITFQISTSLVIPSAPAPPSQPAQAP